MPNRDTPPQDPPPRRGRAAARSRLGCTTCKRRHVRCDETYPVCSHCSRLQLQCYYLRRPRGNHKAGRTPAVDSQRKLLPLPSSSVPISASTDSPSPMDAAVHANNEGGPFTLTEDHMAQFMSLPWLDDSMSSVTHLCREVPDMGVNWTGEFGNFMEPGTAPSLDAASQEGLNSLPCIELDHGPGDLPTHLSSTIRTLPHANSDVELATDAPVLPNETLARPSGNRNASRDASRDVSPSRQLVRNASRNCPPHQDDRSDNLAMFGNIMQPPAAMLMGGIRRWRYLQRYLLSLGTKNSAVMNALLCLEEVLSCDDPEAYDQASDSDSANQIAERYEAAKNQVIQRTAEKHSLEEQEMNELLAAVFLLAWIQVIRDRGMERSECAFPCDQADMIISSTCNWNWYSRQLLSWFNSLDSKATHLGGPSLLSPKALSIVSRFPIQIISCNYEEFKERQKSLDGQENFQTMSAGSVTDVSEHGDSATVVPALTTVDVKEIVLRAILQPAAEWYLQTQRYFRHIGSLHKHHRSRFTPDDELEVGLVGKQFQNDLWDLWAERPSAISLTSTDLSKTMASDMAIRLEEVFSVYLASFWILFVYLHRVCWWHLAHTPTVHGALDETWDSFQRSYGERDDCGQMSGQIQAALGNPATQRPGETKTSVGDGEWEARHPPSFSNEPRRDEECKEVGIVA
ncbi:C6 finger domain-containing [Fusarium albosuccineum]|uniref:C6 finger domain-containing n=1 Tax=Fusarium albosuccineum TaxID=1237068 RepID=A0A8H4LMM6_9HYPO|nr:C6 finger domain-containing [Fusarium albosuccineum]